VTRSERGAFTPAALVFITALFVLAAFVANAEAAFDTRRAVEAAAASAARAGAQASPDSLAGGSPLDASGADARAQQILAAAGYTGSVAVDGDLVVVTATGHVHTFMPDPFGLDGKAVTMTASATATGGVVGAAQ
jgi:hypothetical protein